MKKYIIHLFLFFFASLLSGQGVNGVAEKIASAYGIANFGNVKSIQYTFNVQKGEKHISRVWKWFPEEKKVISGTGENKVEYNRNSFDKNDSKMKKLDHQFINDNYWLLFPFRLVWDKSVKVEVAEESAESPINGIKTMKIRASYIGNDGYTPNDIYELFVNENYNIVEWVYRPGGAVDKNYPATWSAPEDFGGIKISTRHENKDGSFKLWFSGIKVEMK